MANTASFEPSIASQISHDLRIPLTGILGMVHFLSKTALNAEQREYVDTILASANQLVGLETKLHHLLTQPH